MDLRFLPEGEAQQVAGDHALQPRQRSLVPGMTRVSSPVWRAQTPPENSMRPRPSARVTSSLCSKCLQSCAR